MFTVRPRTSFQRNQPSLSRLKFPDKVLKVYPYYFVMQELVGKDPKVSGDAIANAATETGFDGILRSTSEPNESEGMADEGADDQVGLPLIRFGGG